MQVKALFDTLKEAGIAYIDSVIDFGAGPRPGHETRRGSDGVRDYLETTLIDGADFEGRPPAGPGTLPAVRRRGPPRNDGPIPRVLKLDDLRIQGVWPME